jgi:hypothetical protein
VQAPQYSRQNSATTIGFADHSALTLSTHTNPAQPPQIRTEYDAKQTGPHPHNHSPTPTNWCYDVVFGNIGLSFRFWEGFSMYAVEFEADITSPFIPLQNYQQFLNQHVRVIVLSDHQPVATDRKIETAYLDTLRKRNFVVPAGVDVDSLMSEMNNGLS